MIALLFLIIFFFFSSRRRHTRCSRDWSSDVCSSDLRPGGEGPPGRPLARGTEGVMLDAARCRADFPLLQGQEHGHRLVYLDNAATTQKPQAVLDAILDYYRTTNANVHRGAYGLAIRATEAYEAARERVARFLNAWAPE